MDENSAFPEASKNRGEPTALSARIIGALNEQEAHSFFHSGSAHSRRLDFEYCSDLAQILRLNPEVLVTCWSTPRLPEAWLMSPECNVRYICNLTGSVRHFLPRAFIERGGLVTNWGDLPSAAVAEHAILLALAALRNQPAWTRFFCGNMHVTERMERVGARTLRGRPVGIFGIGWIAQRLARLLHAFDTRVSAFSADAPDSLFTQCGVSRATSLRELFSGSEVVFVCEGLSQTTALAIGTKELAALPDDAVLVNVARSGLIDENALLAELRNGRLRAGLDVFDREPLKPDSPWFSVPGVVMSPHIGGPTADQYIQCAKLAFDNIARFQRGEPLQFLVTKEIYDRAT